ncbi:basic proline-rich protein-like [Talpa occidentalis]|uniref:basic proline-rich protein-like n=1 Tax=Talpa occidentalis TaxID=50954 RepID=UPI0023F855E0|nr:basic proline-rich protein-like [Talpa occidentalis]
MAQTEQRTERGLTGSPRAQGGSGGSRAAPGTGERRLSRAPVGGGRRVGSRGGDQGRSRHRRAPAFPTPQARPRLASAPRCPRPPAAPPAAALRLGSRAPSSCRRPETPPPPPAARRVRGSARLVLPASPPRPRPAGAAAYPPLRRGGPARTPPAAGGKGVGDPTAGSRLPKHEPLHILDQILNGGPQEKGPCPTQGRVELRREEKQLKRRLERREEEWRARRIPEGAERHVKKLHLPFGPGLIQTDVGERPLGRLTMAVLILILLFSFQTCLFLTLFCGYPPEDALDLWQVIRP